MIACTGNAADYKWIAEPGEDYDNQIQPSFATIKGMYLDDTDPLSHARRLTLLFSDNWFDSNFGNNERFLLITSALELVFINHLIDAGRRHRVGVQAAQGRRHLRANAAGYLGTLKGSWKLVKIHPEFLPKVYTDSNLVVDPVATSATAKVVRCARSSLWPRTRTRSRPTSTSPSVASRTAAPGSRARSTSRTSATTAGSSTSSRKGVVPLFLPAVLDNLQVVDDSFDYVAAKVAAARAQTGIVQGNTYPMSGPTTELSKPEWFHPPYNTTSNLDATLTVQETGDVAHNHEIDDVP
jgi:hypothetical protein